MLTNSFIFNGFAEFLTKYYQVGIELNKCQGVLKPSFKMSERDGAVYARMKMPEIRHSHIHQFRINIIREGGHNEWVCLIQAPKEEKLKVSYDGRLYESGVSIVENDMIVYQNQELAELMESFKGRTDLESIVIGDILYVYTTEEMRTKPEIRKLIELSERSNKMKTGNSPVKTRALYDDFNFMENDALGFFALFDNDRYEGMCIYNNLRSFYDFMDVYNLKDFELNDKITSLSLAYNGTDSEVCSVLTVWEDNNFNNGDSDRTKHRISFIATKEKPRISELHLKLIPCIGSGNSWNDRISSFYGLECYWGLEHVQKA